MTTHGVVIVGGGLAAVRIAEQLRKADYAGPVTIVSDEDHPPYDRPPLSKEILQNEDRGLADVALKPIEFYADNDITLRLGSAAQTLDTTARILTLADGTELHYDDLVIATGLVPKRIPSLPDLAGIRVLRTIDESLALRRHAAHATRAVVIGAGFIGCEVAASLRKLGVDVVLVEPQPTPLAGVLGEPIGELVARVHRAEGVDVRTGAGVAEVRGDDHVRQVVLSDGAVIDADLVIIGIGSRPATGWLSGADIELAADGGVLCDEAGRATAPHVWAVGDVASWRDAHGNQSRVEHWSNVADQVRVLVAAMLDQEQPNVVAVPYFWSDQYDVKIQCLGEPKATDTVHVVEDDGRKFLAYYSRDGMLVGVVGGGMPGKVMKARAKIAGAVPIADVLG